MAASDDANPKKWTYPAHTKAKHDLLRYYLGGWFPTLTLGGNQRVLFLDGFAGRGIYNEGEKGSPIIALETLLDHRSWSSISNREFIFIFIEANRENCARLQDVINNFMASRAPWPQNVKVYIFDQSFQTYAESLTLYLRQQKASLAPTLAFIDPFGFKGMPMSAIADLLNHRACEVLVNFMIMYVNRFLEQEHMGANMNELFGLQVPEILARCPGEQRVARLRDVYAWQLRTVAGFPYVQSFAMKNSHGNIEYYLFHGTRSPKGVELMKAAMWKLDPLGNFTFDDRTAEMNNLITEPPLHLLQEQIRHQFQGQAGVSTVTIKNYTNLYTTFRAPHLTTILKRLEEQRLIRVNRPRPNAQFGPSVTIDFL